MATETPKEDLEAVGFKLGKGVTHNHAGKDYGEGETVILRRGQAKRLVAADKGQIVKKPAGADKDE